LHHHGLGEFNNNDLYGQFANFDEDKSLVWLMDTTAEPQ
jgi:hypothetical protein